LVLVSSEREQRPLYTPPQKLRRRIRTAFATVLHSRASILHEAPILHFELLNCTG